MYLGKLPTTTWPDGTASTSSYQTGDRARQPVYQMLTSIDRITAYASRVTESPEQNGMLVLVWQAPYCEPDNSTQRVDRIRDDEPLVLCQCPGEWTTCSMLIHKRTKSTALWTLLHLEPRVHISKHVWCKAWKSGILIIRFKGLVLYDVVDSRSTSASNTPKTQ